MRKIFLTLFITTIFLDISACDICGCGVGNNYIGIMPEFNKKIMGLRYRYNSMRTHLGVGGNATYLTSNEYYRTIEWWGGWNFGKKFRVMANVPFSFNERKNQGTEKAKDGIGDISFSGFYQLIHSKRTIRKKLLVQSLFVGGGIKLPTGKYNAADKQNSNENANLFQLGTGSTDFSLNLMYDIRLQDVGLNVNAAYKMNTSNKYDYNYGNKFTGNAQFYYKYKVNKKLVVAPNAGLLFETSQKDIDRTFDVDISGGNILCGSFGLEATYKKIAIGTNFQKVISQDLANGFVKAGNRAMAHISFMF